MPNVKNNISAQETRRRLIEAAGEVFAERGLHAATTKQITDRAGVNIAAINYHFKDKFELYAAVIRRALSLTPIAQSPAVSTGPPEERLRAYISGIMEDLYSPQRPAWLAPILAHEFAQPTAALDAVIEELVRPRANLMQGIVRGILGPGFSEEQVLRASLSVAAQCFMYLYQREVVRRLHPRLTRNERPETIARHITEFSLAALRTMRRNRRACRSQRVRRIHPAAAR